MKKIFTAVVYILFFYFVIWSYNNIDFNSIFKDTKHLLQYEFNKNNLKNNIEAFVNMIQKRIP